MRIVSLLSPVCLVIALLMLVAGFAILATEGPSESVSLHAARASGNELMEEAWNQQLIGQRWFRRLLLAALFAGSLLMTLLAFVTLRGKP